MARYTFGGTDDMQIQSKGSGNVMFAAPGSVMTWWSAITGGTQYTDLLLNGSPVTTITADSNGYIPLFSGPDGVSQMWGSADGSARHLAVSPVNFSGTYVATANRPVALKDNTGIDFTGTTDSATALQAAITAAGAGTPIEFGRPGVIRCDTGITLSSFQQLDGGSTYLGAGGTAPGELRFTNIGSTGVGVTGFAGGNNVLRNLLIRGPMTGANSTVGFSSASGAPRFHAVGFYGWAVGASLTGAYYTKFFDECEWSGNKTGLLTSGCFNMEHFGSRFNCLYNGTSLGVGIDGAARGMTLHGGSIENHGAGGGVRVYAGQVLDMFGTYFESSSAASGAFGILAAGIDKATLNLYGCTVYLTETSRWLHATGSTNMVLNSWGNKFVCPNTSSSTPIAYNFASTDVANIKGIIGRDDWSEMAKVGSSYTATAVANLGQIPGLDIRHPSLSYIGAIVTCTGSPNSQIIGSVGNICLRSDGGAATTLYVKESGAGTNTGWVAK